MLSLPLPFNLHAPVPIPTPAEECKERAQTTPDEERRPQEWVQRVLLTTRSRAVSLHTTHEITSQASGPAC